MNQKIILSNEKKTYIIISCSAKSGSLTLYKSFLRIHPLVQHSHNIDKDCQEGAGFCRGTNILKFIIDNKDKHNFVLIDSFREPLERKISSFFHNILSHSNLTKQEIIQLYKENKIYHLIDFFKRKCLDNLEEYYSYNHWKKLGYNVEEYDFNKDTRVQYHKINNLHFINLRFIDIDQWTDIIKSLPLPIPKLQEFRIINLNLSYDKWYYNIYSKFKKEFIIDKDTLDRIYLKHAWQIKHFLSPLQFQQLIHKWTFKNPPKNNSKQLLLDMIDKTLIESK